MCGIAGIMRYDEAEVDRRVLVRMTRALVHRGPDDEGYYTEPGLGLGHRRLSIVDTSNSGHQPMSEGGGRYWIAFNGELYNYLDYRDGLQARFGDYVGTSDTEVLLRLLCANGTECLEELAGIFAFAFWDRETRQLLLVRDPLGVKQLYVHDDGQRVLFASELKALVGAIDAEVEPRAIAEYLNFHTPLFERTFFRGVSQLQPGHAMLIGPGSQQRTWCYWRIERFANARISREQAVFELRDLLRRVVHEQLMADVPVGAFFSGGIDSSAVAAFARETGRLRHGFGVHFSGQGVIDERPYQEEAAKALGLDLDLITVDGSTFPEDLEQLLYYQDAPVIGPALFPMYYVSRLAASKVTVCLGGQGADEIFGGYARYALAKPSVLPLSIGRLLLTRFLRRRARKEGAEHQVGGSLLKQLLDRHNLRRALRTLRNLHDYRRRYFDHFVKVPETIWNAVLQQEEHWDRRELWETFSQLVDATPGDNTTRLLHWDARTYLAGLFHQDDRMSMANSLESRVPIADPRIVRFAFTLPDRLKIHAATSKWVLREAVKDVLPEFVLNRRKVGFDTPVRRWMRELHPEFTRDLLLGRQARERGWFDTNALEQIWNDHKNPYWNDVIWKCVCLEAWARVFFDGATYQHNARAAAIKVREARHLEVA